MASQQLVQGRIVWAHVPDSEGGNPKDRPAVIITATDEICDEEPFAAVAATTSFKEPLPSSSVKLPWHPRGMVRTRLKKPTVAVCDWLLTIRAENVLEIGGVVPPNTMQAILAKIASP